LLGSQSILEKVGWPRPQLALLWSAIEVVHKNQLPRVLTITLINASFSYIATYMNEDSAEQGDYSQQIVIINFSKRFFF